MVYSNSIFFLCFVFLILFNVPVTVFSCFWFFWGFFCLNLMNRDAVVCHEPLRHNTIYFKYDNCTNDVTDYFEKMISYGH